MAINKNHEFEDLGTNKCAIVEKNASAERVHFLKTLLEFNKYDVVVVDSPAPKAAPAAPVAAAPVTEGDATPTPTPAPAIPAAPAAPTTFTVGVTDLTFNATNAIFSRQLKTADGHIVSLAYWQEKEAVSNDEVPYFDNK
jgi:hypothetical protein